MAPVPPFYENWDDTHCSQCTLRGVLETFEPGEDWNWERIDELSGKIPGKWTWPYRQQVSLLERGYQVVSISDTAPQEYLERGIYEVLLERLGKEGADKQREMSDFEVVRAEMQDYVAWLETGNLVRFDRLPTMADIEHYLAEGYLVSSSVNLRTLNGREGYNSHIVLVYAVEGDDILFHDSGLPAHPSRRVSRAEFVKAATTPKATQWNLLAYKKS